MQRFTLGLFGLPWDFPVLFYSGEHAVLRASALVTRKLSLRRATFDALELSRSLEKLERLRSRESQVLIIDCIFGCNGRNDHSWLLLRRTILPRVMLSRRSRSRSRVNYKEYISAIS